MYLLKLWNGEWSDKAKFVAYNPQTKKYTVFSPERPDDVIWVKEDITKSPDYKKWQDCEDEPIDDFSDAAI